MSSTSDIDISMAFAITASLRGTTYCTKNIVKDHELCMLKLHLTISNHSEQYDLQIRKPGLSHFMFTRTNDNVFLFLQDPKGRMHCCGHRYELQVDPASSFIVIAKSSSITIDYDIALMSNNEHVYIELPVDEIVNVSVECGFPSLTMKSLFVHETDWQHYKASEKYQQDIELQQLTLEAITAEQNIHFDLPNELFFAGYDASFRCRKTTDLPVQIETQIPGTIH